MLHVETLTDYTAVRALVPAWRELLNDCETNEFTLTPEWMLTWWEVYGAGLSRRLRIIVVRHQRKLVGLAPLLTRRFWYLRLVPIRRVEPLASGEAERDSVCSDYLTILARHGYEADVVQAVLQQLEDCEELLIPLMDGTATMPYRLLEGGQANGWQGTLTETTQSPYILLPPTWEAYLKQLRRKDRYLIQRTLRDFENWTGTDWQLHEAEADTLAEGTRILHTLHEFRWTGQGVFQSLLFRTFHARVMVLLLQQQALELFWLTVRSKPVAAMYNIRWNRKTSFYQCGRAIDVPPGIRPGAVLLYLAIRRAIESGQREFDLLGGESVYKRQVASHRRPLVTLRLVRANWKERLRQWVERSKDRLRPWWRQLRQRPIVATDS